MLNSINDYWSLVTDRYCMQIEMITGTQKSALQVQENLMQLFDKYAHEALDYYGKMFSRAMEKMNQK